MAYINVSEWTPEHVAEWLRGLEGSILPYVHFFLNNDIDGHHLLNLSPDDLNGLHIFKIGHQELILEAVDLLRQLHYGLTLETLQFLALKLGCKARSLHNDLKLNGPQESSENTKQERVSTDTLSAVSDILVSVRSFVSWLDRFPFEHQEQYIQIKRSVLKLSIELASTAQRDQFAEKPHVLIKSSSLELAELCDKVVQEFNDSLIIQPASLDIATVKKKPDEELGMHITSSYSGVHVIASIKPQSPATRCTKIEEGDEIVQVNYQTVTGWHLKSFLEAMKEHSTEIHFTLKKRPRHTNILGQIIILRPYRIPSKKTAFGKVHKWSEGNSSLHIQEVYSATNDSENARDSTNDSDDDDSAFLPDGATTNKDKGIQENSIRYRMFSCPAHATVQRRATVSGASPTVLKAPVKIEDLVNGVPMINRKENISRSISHDPSKLSTSVEKNSVMIEPGAPKKSREVEGNKENMLHKKADNVEYHYVGKNTGASQTFTASSDNKGTSCSLAEPLKRDKSPIQTSDILAVHEEEYTILENKSLEKIRKNVPVHKVAVVETSANELRNTSRQDFLNSCIIQRNGIVSPNEFIEYPISITPRIIAPFPSSNITASAHATETSCNENATDKNHMFFQRTKMKCSENRQTSWSQHTQNSSYAVIGGATHNFATGTKVIKAGRRTTDSVESPQKRKTGIVEKFGSRRISCKDLGMGDCQGWLYKQKDGKGIFPSVSQWTKRWIILKNHHLYSYHSRNDTKAECLIFLPGSTVSPAMGCKSKKYCFKVCQLNTTFYFATETQCDLSKWMNKMGLAAIAYDATCDVTTSGFLKPEVVLGVGNVFYSETDESDDSSTKDFNRSFREGRRNDHTSSSTSSDHSNISRKAVDKYQLKSTFFKPENSNWCNYEAKSSSQFEPKYAKSQTNNPYYPSEYPSCRNSLMPSKEPPTTEFFGNSQRISYNRSFSCTEATNSQSINNKIQYLAQNMTYEDSCDLKSVPCSYGALHTDKKMLPSSSRGDEEYDNILSSSLGRQKPVAKEITPGLVARMAVSYSNLSHKNAAVSSSTGNHSKFKDVPAPGYVAKISDSFDHLARSGSSDIPKCHQLTKSKSSSRQALAANTDYSQNSSYKRSASESHVAQNFYNSSHKISSTCPPSKIHPSNFHKNAENDSPIPEKLVSRLDRDHYRLYGRKKVSPASMKSPISPNTDASKMSERAMRFFPEPDKNSQSSFLSNVKMSPADEPQRSFPKNETVGFYSSSSSKTPKGHQENLKQQSTSFLGTHGLKSQIQSVFRQQTKKACSDFSKGIENIGFYSPDQGKQKPCEEKQVLCKVQTISTSEHCNRLSAYYEDTSSPFYSKCELESNLPPKSATLDSSIAKHNSPFKLFGSSKFMEKLSSPKLDKKNIFKSKKQAKEIKKAEQKDFANLQSERKFLGSPRLARAIFGSPKSQTKPVVTVSSSVQTDSGSVNAVRRNGAEASFSGETRSLRDNQVAENSTDYPPSNINCSTSSCETDQRTMDSIKTSSNSSLNSDASSSILSASTTSSHYYVETRIKPQVTISLPIITNKAEDRATTPEAPRTPLKPTMGIAMLGKRRLPSVSGESSVSLLSSKSSHEESSSESVQLRSEIKMEISGENDGDEMIHVLDILRRADLSVDGVDLRARRCRTILMHFSSKHLSQLILELRALQRTLKDKESEVAAIDELFENSAIDHELLANWIAAHSDIFQMNNS